MLGFQGLIVTDALVMGAIAKLYDQNAAPILALIAGADLIMMPVDPEGAINAVYDAATTGRISVARIRESVERIWQAKSRVFSQSKLEQATNYPLIFLNKMAQPSARSLAREIMKNSLQIYGPVPIPKETIEPGKIYRHLILVDQAIGCDFLPPNAPAIAWSKQLGYQNLL